MRGFRRFAIATTIATYFLIFVGGLVRVAGAGLGCPDWPKCFGRWIPPLSVTQIPADIDLHLFNLTLAWIEWVNRLVGVIIGILIVITAILAIRKARKYPAILWSTIAAALLVAYQGWLGSVVVSSELAPWIVSMHMVLALLIVSLLLYATQLSYHKEQKTISEHREVPKLGRVLTGIVWIVSIFQVFLGSQVRESIEHARADFPLLSDSDLLTRVGGIVDFHLFSGLFVALAAVFVSLLVIKMARGTTALLRQTALAIAFVAFAQVLLGLVMMTGLLTTIAPLFHLWGASLMVGLLLLLYVHSLQKQTATDERPRSFATTLVGATLVVIVLGIGANAVVNQAERSRADIQVYGQVPDFEYVDNFGEPYGYNDMLGKICVVDFIFTRCRGACPTMAVEVGDLYDLYAHSDQVQLVSICVDPDHDTLLVRQEYLRNLGVTDDRWRFLRGDIDSVKALARDGFFVSDDFPGLHSTKLILVDQIGRIRGYYEHTEPSAMKRIRQDIRTLSRELP